MFKKIFLTIVITIMTLSGSFIFTGVSLADASYNNKTNCGDVWNRFNAREKVSSSEFKVCKKEIIKAYRIEIREEYSMYKENANYCREKYNEISYRRNATFIENKLCGKKFKKYEKEELAYKERVLRNRGIVYGK